jgi:hypothetical protein
MPPFHRKLTAALPLLLLTLGAASAAAQGYPPAQGPLLAGGDGRYIPMFVVNYKVDSTIQAQLDVINAKISREADSTGIEAHLSFSRTTYKPAMSTTQYPDRPNENVVRVPFIISYDVTGIRYHGLGYFDREIGQSLSIEFSCHDWFTGRGQVRATSRADRPYLNGTSFGEDVLNFFIANSLTDLVDSKLRAALPGAMTSVGDSLGACNRLGVTPGTAPDYRDGQIDYALVRVPRSLPTAWDASVTFQSIKRLPARTLGGDVLYNDAEDIQLVFYANQTGRSAQLLEMREGDERSLGMPAVELGRLGGGAQLVLILNVEQLTSFQRDSRFAVYSRDNDFGNGTRKVVVRKTYWEPPQRLPDGRLTKPTKREVDAYEITVLVNAPPPLLTEGDRVVMPPSAGTRALEAGAP